MQIGTSQSLASSRAGGAGLDLRALSRQTPPALPAVKTKTRALYKKPAFTLNKFEFSINYCL